MSQLLSGAAKAEIEAFRNDLTPGELAERRIRPKPISTHRVPGQPAYQIADPQMLFRSLALG